jgi:hypothetical protein
MDGLETKWILTIVPVKLYFFKFLRAFCGAQGYFHILKDKALLIGALKFFGSFSN